MAGVFARPRTRAPVVLMGQGPAPAGATVDTTWAKGWTSCPARGPSPPRCPAPSTPGCCCCATTARGSSGRCWTSRSAMRGTGTRCWAGSAPRSRPCRSCSGALAHVGRTVDAGGPDPGRGRAGAQPGLCPDAAEAGPGRAGIGEAVGADGAHARGPDRCRPPRMARGFRGPGHGRVRAGPAPALVRHRPPRRAAHGRLAGFEAGYETAATVEFRGHTIAKTGPWGQGPALLQTLAILDGFEDGFLDPSTELGAHTILEAQKLALADREAYYGDTDVPLDYLLSEEYCCGAPGADHRERRRTSSGRARCRGASRTSRRCAPSTRRRRGTTAARAPTAGCRRGPLRRRRADRAADRGDPRRHLPHRRRGPLGQHGLGHAVGRLAAVLAGDPGARLLPGHPAADDLAGARARRPR